MRQTDARPRMLLFLELRLTIETHIICTYYNYDTNIALQKNTAQIYIRNLPAEKVAYLGSHDWKANTCSKRVNPRNIDGVLQSR